MTKSLEVLIQAEAALKALKATDTGVLIGAEVGNALIIIGVVAGSSQNGDQGRGMRGITSTDQMPLDLRQF